METLVILEPRDDPNETLQKGLMQRKTLELRSNGATEIELGRGSITGIGDNSIGSSVVKISIVWSGNTMLVQVILQRDAARCEVYVNGLPFPYGCGNVYLNSGDTISLHRLRYEYRVHISEISASASAPGSDPFGGDLGILDCDDFWSTSSHIASPNKSDPVVEISPTECSQISDELQCSVCLEIQVNSRTLHPCGHSVCAACISKLSECPQCRVKPNSHIPNMQLDSLISRLVSIPSLLDAEDVKSYKERSTNAKVFPVVYLNSTSGKKHARSSMESGRSVRRVRSPHGVRSGGVSPQLFAIAGQYDEFDMPFLGPSIPVATGARLATHSRYPRNYSGTTATVLRQNARSSSHASSWSHPQSYHSVSIPPSVAQQAGNSLENAISID